MSVGLSVSVDMDEKFVQFLSKNVSLGREVTDVVKKHGAGMQQLAQSYAPVDTGFLKRHIRGK
ncbi:hypothetical protein [Ligilactobacillus murinus]|jgi:hypothetical protein|uniref:hypothetical protein n=1 Tax=Ligilactobacillus murinus TaxID=1622 RepID=UPI002DD640D0|nr:hypothetical protein [Ligilactobacillus murinus]WRY38703.1 hypothetical protein P8F80_05330 [Ligilactobacillus murinus]